MDRPARAIAERDGWLVGESVGRMEGSEEFAVIGYLPVCVRLPQGLVSPMRG